MPDMTAQRILEILEAQRCMDSVGSSDEEMSAAMVILEDITQVELNDLRLILERMHVIEKILEQ